MTAVDSLTPIGHALLTASATVVCLFLAEWFGLEHANLAVWTTYMVMAQYEFTLFQKGVERIVGRGLGIIAGLVLTTWFLGAPLLALALTGGLLMTTFYFYFAGRLAYTFLNAGLYLVAMLLFGLANPASATTAAWELFVAIVLGVIVADVVTWLSGAEDEFGIQFGQAPLLPLRGVWLSHSAMLTVTVLLTMVGAHFLRLSPQKAAFSVMVLTVTPHVQAMLLKGELRIAGALLATAWAFGVFVIVGILPHLPLLAALLFLGQFIAAYIARTAGEYAYAGIQMGLVLPLLIVAPRADFGSLAPAAERLIGILLALVASVVVAVLWPRFPLSVEKVISEAK